MSTSSRTAATTPCESGSNAAMRPPWSLVNGFVEDLVDEGESAVDGEREGGEETNLDEL
jgi:hypothetical protein